MAIITEHLQLNKQFLIIDSPVPFTLIANNGTDEVYRMAGAWQIDTHKLLPEKYQKQYPVFNLDLVYDDINLNGKTVTVRESNIDIGDGISGVNGQDVKITNFSEISPLQIKNELDNNNDKIPLDVNITNSFFLNINYLFNMDNSDIKSKFLEVMEKLYNYPNDNNYYYIDLKNISTFTFGDYIPDLPPPGMYEKEYKLKGNELYFYQAPDFTYYLKGTLKFIQIAKNFKSVIFKYDDINAQSKSETLTLNQGLFNDIYTINSLRLNF